MTNVSYASILGAKANDFMYFNSTEDILDWIREDDILIKLTGEEKADVVQGTLFWCFETVLRARLTR
jgi:hypothetical protein